jgi:hypothetical protein
MRTNVPEKLRKIAVEIAERGNALLSRLLVLSGAPGFGARARRTAAKAAALPRNSTAWIRLRCAQPKKTGGVIRWRSIGELKRAGRGQDGGANVLPVRDGQRGIGSC